MKQKCERSCATAMGVLERATGFLAARLDQLVEEEKEKISILYCTRKKNRMKGRTINLVKRTKKARQWRTISCIFYVVKKEEEDDVSHIQRIFGPVSEDVLAVARVKFTSLMSG